MEIIENIELKIHSKSTSQSSKFDFFKTPH